MIKEVAIALAGGSLGALVGAFATVFVAQRRLHAENIGAERTKWRDKIRLLSESLTQEPHTKEKAGAWVSFALNTNPTDPEDLAIVALAMEMLGAEQINSDQREEFAGRVALLLKHDWERAKIEASWRPWRRSCRLPYSGNKPSYSPGDNKQGPVTPN